MIDKLQGLKNELQGTVLEFFLGKNVIAKIAIFLIFLGVMSFGQLAYVDWLNDIGRMIMIGTIGLIVSVIGYYFERCQSIVFSNVFYVLGIFTLFLTNMLSYNTYWLYSFNTMMIINIGMMIASFIYFSYRRTEFLDGALLLMYSIIATLPTQYLDIFPDFLEVTLFYLTLGLFLTITLMYWTTYYKNHTYMQIVLFIMLGYLINSYTTIIHITRSFGEMSLILQLSYLGLFVGLLYLAMIKIIKTDIVIIRVLSSLTFLYLITRIMIATGVTLDMYFNHTNFNYGPHMFFTIVGSLFFLVFPLQLYIDHLNDHYSSRLMLAFLIITGILLSIEPIYSNIYTEELVNLFPLLLSILMLGIYLWKGKMSYQISSIIFVGYSILTILFGHTIRDLKPYYDDLWMFIPTLVTVLFVVFIPLVCKSRTKTDRLTVVSLLALLLGIIPTVFTFVYEWNIYSEEIIFAWVFVVLLIGFRYFVTIPLFKNKYTKHFTMAILGKIVLVTFIANFWYFDHHLSQLDDVLFLLFTLGLNAYVALALYDLYHLEFIISDGEYQFIVYYILGAIVQSIWIHRYVNVEFDKVILSSFFMISSAIGILIGFRHGWQLSRKIGLGVIYFSLLKFFIYDFFTQDFSTIVRMITYFILGFTLLGISFLYSYLEKTYGTTIPVKSYDTYKTPLIED